VVSAVTETTLDTILGHLGTCLVQQSSKDDAIIMGHIRDAYDLLQGLARIQRNAQHPVGWEDVSHLLCRCGKDHCDANNHAPDHDMSADRYVEEYGCGTKEVYERAERVAKFINDRELVR
jgi:hypothetical protein